MYVSGWCSNRFLIAVTYAIALSNSTGCRASPDASAGGGGASAGAGAGRGGEGGPLAAGGLYAFFCCDGGKRFLGRAPISPRSWSRSSRGTSILYPSGRNVLNP